MVSILISPSIYLDEPWRSEIPANREVYLPEVPYGDAVERYLNYEFRYRLHEQIALLWCFKHEWGLKIPELRKKLYKKFESRGLFLQQILRLCIQVHTYYASGYRNAAHWFAEILADFDQDKCKEIFTEVARDRGNKKADTSQLRDNLEGLKCGENPYIERDMPHFILLIDLAIRHGHKDSQQQIKSIADTWKAFIKAYSAYITFRNKSSDVGDFFISREGKLCLQQGQGQSIKPFLEQVATLLKAHKKNILSETFAPYDFYDLLHKLGFLEIHV